MQLTEQQRMDMTPKGFGLPKKLWRQLLKFRNKTVKECASDLMFKHMTFYNAYMQLHPHRNFDYRFNSWGFRADYDYEALNVDGKKAKIILAISKITHKHTACVTGTDADARGRKRFLGCCLSTLVSNRSLNT